MIALALVQVKVAGTATTEDTMTGTASLFPAFPSLESLIRSNVHYMSRHILGMSYEAVQKIIYPKPRYKTFLIAKRSGSPRIIQEPRRALKDLQLKVLKFLEERSDKPKPCVHGFTRRRSIVTNARKHCSRQTHHLLNIDIKDFFPSIDFFRVRGVLRGKPFECSHAVATVLAHLCTYHNKLPQGAPTSPILANLVCRSMDRDLMDLARRHRATYTRYADDMTFSFSARKATNLPANICTFDSGALVLGHELEAIVDRNSFHVNPEKSRLSTRLHRLEVTGITINEFPNVKRIFIDRIRGALHAWEKYDHLSAQIEWEKRIVKGMAGVYEKRPWKRQRRTNVMPKLKNILWGKLLYVRMVRGANDVIYTRLAEHYNALCVRELAIDANFSFSPLPIEHIVRNAYDAERAVFVVEWNGDYQPAGVAESEMVGSQGTAFAYEKRNCLITCDHVLGWAGTISDAAISMDYSSIDVHNKSITVRSPTLGITWAVKVVHRDPNRDLAILQFVDPPHGHRHFSGIDSRIKRNEKGFLIGFPNWSPGRVANQLEAVVVNRFARTALQRFEISTNIRQGNSGGPFVDELYRVAGVAQQGATQVSGNDECLCVEELDRWISAWKAMPVPPAASAPVPLALAAPPEVPIVTSVSTT